jgi:predicted transcriptional regulator
MSTLNAQRSLTATEKLVLFAFVEEAKRTDAEVAERTHLKESTVRTCRQNLINNGHLRFVNFPAFHKFGCDLVVSHFGDMSLAASLEEKNEGYKTFFRMNPQVVDAVLSCDFIAFLGVFRGLSDFLLFWDRHNLFFKEKRILQAPIEPALFPIEISRWPVSYNFAPCFQRVLGLDLEDPVARMPLVLEKRTVRLSKVERETFMEMISCPNATDASIAEDVGRSRPRVTELTNQLAKAGLCEHVGVPAMLSPEFGATAYVHLKFHPGISFQKKSSVAGDDWWRQSCSTHHRDSEVTAVYPFIDLTECISLLNQFIGPFKSEGMLASEPFVRVVLENTTIDLVDGAFAPLMRQLIE